MDQRLIAILWLGALAQVAGCAQARCKGDACAGPGPEAQISSPVQSAHYRIALRVDPIAASELRSEHYRLRAVLAPAQLEVKP